MKKVLLGLTMLNFGLSLWFSQYIPPGLLAAVYVVGSLYLMAFAMILTE